MKSRLFLFLKSFLWPILVVTVVVGVTPADAQDYLLVTKGGGVTGNTTSFRISPTGEVARSTGSIDPVFSEFAQLRKSKAKKYFRKTRALMEEQTFNHPGNTYTAIALVRGGNERKLVWGDATHETPVRAARLYQKIQASLNRLTFRKDLRK